MTVVLGYARPVYETWIDWAKDMYVAGKMTFQEFEDYLDRALLDDRPWEPLPGGLSTGPLRMHYLDGTVRDYSFEREVEARRREHS